ncbi:inosine/guanosine kinase [Myxococcota bacterium]|nr:inosine/guanosine kinase [Myxococcota bacterium]
MLFPGNRIVKHYFPVTAKATRLAPTNDADNPRWYIAGLDEILVDVEVRLPSTVADELGLRYGESVHLSDDAYQSLLKKIESESIHHTYSAGGTVANTLHNFTHLSGEPAVLFGSIEDAIRPGTPAFAYVAQTPPALNLRNVVGQTGSTGVAITFVSEDGERSFGVVPGVASQLPPECINPEVVKNAAVAVTTLYTLFPKDQPIGKATLRMMQLAKDAGVPVAFGLGTASLVSQHQKEVRQILKDYVSIAAMNAQEAAALTGETDTLLAAQKVLDCVDLVIITEGERGLTLGAWTDEAAKRETNRGIRSKSIPEYNRWEFSRSMLRDRCESPIKIYSHTHPYRGGPDRLGSTNGAGDAVLAAVLHDVAANTYHRKTVPGSEKHTSGRAFLTYSSLSRNAQYGNRVAYEVLRAHSPRLNAPVGADEE